MVAEYLIKAGLDTSGLAADLKKIDHFFDPRTLMLRVDYNNSDVKAVQNMIDNIADNDYTVAIKMEYDLNKSILDAQLRKLSDMQEFTISGKLDKTLVNELNKVNEQFEGDINLKKFDYIEDGLNRIRAIINTIDEVGGNVGNDLRKSVADAVEAVEDVYGRKLKDVGSIFTKEDIINQQSVVAYYQDIVSTIDDALKRAQDETAGHNLIIDNLEIDSSAVQGAIDKASKGVKVTVDRVDFDFKDLDPETQDKLNEYYSTRREAAHAYQSRLDENAANEKRINQLIEDNEQLSKENQQLQEEMAKINSSATGLVGSGSGDGVGSTSDDEVATLEERLQKRSERLKRALEIAKEAKQKQSEIQKELASTQKQLEDSEFWKSAAQDYAYHADQESDDLRHRLEEKINEINELESLRDKLSQEIKSLEEENETLIGDSNFYQGEVSGLIEQNVEFESDLSRLNEAFLEACNDIDKLEQQKKELEEKLRSIQDFGESSGSGDSGSILGNINISTEQIQKFMTSIEELVGVLGELRTALSSIGDMKLNLNFSNNIPAQAYKDIYENNRITALSQLDILYGNLRDQINSQIRKANPRSDIEKSLFNIASRDFKNDWSKRGFQAILAGNTHVGNNTEQINDYVLAFNALKEVARSIDFDDMSAFDQFEKIINGIKEVGSVAQEASKEVDNGFSNLFKGADLSIVNASIANIEDSLKNLKINIGQIEFPEDTSALTAEQSALRSLVDAIDMVINAIDQKNAAFQAEGQIVDGVINGESSNLTALTGWITMAGEQVEKLQNAFKEIGNFKFDTNFYQQFTDSLNVDKINQDLTELLESFMAFTDLTNGLKLDGTSFLADINSILSKSSDLRNLVDVFKYLENQGMSIKEAAKKFSAETGTIKPQKSVKSQVSSLSKYIDSIDLGDERYTKAYLDRLKAFRTEVANLLKSGVDTKDQDSLDNLHRLMDEMKELKQDAKKAENKVLTDTARSGFDNQLASYQKNLRSTSEYIEQIEDIRERLKTATTMQEKNSLQNEFNQIKTSAQKAGDVGVDTADKLKKALSEASNTLSSVDTVGTTDEFLRRVEYAKKELNSLVGSDFSTQEDVDRLKHLSSVIDKISTDASRNKIVDTDAVIKMADDMDEYKNSLRSTSPYIKEISDLQDRLFNAQSEGDRLDVEDRFKQLKVEAKAAGDVGNNTMKDLEDRFSGLVKEIGSIDTSKFTDNLRNDFNGIKSTVDSITANGGLDFTKEIDVKRLDGLISRLNEIKTKSQQDEFKLVDQDSLLSMTSDINKFYDSLSPSSTFRGELDALREMISDIVTEADRLEAKKIFDNIKLKANASGDTTKTAERSYLERQAKSEIESLYKMESQTRSLSDAISELQAEVKAEGGLDMITNADDEKLTGFIDKIKTLKKEVSQDTSARTGRNGVETRLDRLKTQADNFDLSQIYNVEGFKTTFDKAVSDLERLSSMRFTLSVGDIDTELSGIEARLKSVYEAANRLSKIDLAIEGLQNLDISKLSPKGQKEVNDLIDKLQKLRSDAKSGAIDITVDTSQVKEAMSQVDEFLASKKKAEYQAANELNISALDANMASFASRLKSTSQYIGAIDELRTSLKEVSSGGDFKAIADGFNQIKSAAIDAGDVGKSVMQHLGNRIKQMSINAVAMYLSFYDIIRYARQAFGVIKEYDTALTEMRKVSDYSVDTLKEYQASTFDTAGALGTTALQIQNSTADFMRLGESIDEAKKSAEAANLMMNVSEFDNISEATDSLISMSAAYSDVEKMDIVDKMNEIGNNYAISTDGVATALQNSAASLVTAGNDIDEAVALVTAGNVITQDPNKVGSGIRTIALRLTGTKEAKAELEEMGEETEDVITTQSKLRDTIMSATKVASNEFKGFDILDDNGNYKSTYEIMLGIADIYDEIAATDKKFGSNNLNLLLETMAGKNRSNIAASILQNGEILKEAYMSSMNADGSAMKENEKYLDSLEGKIQQFTNAAHEALNSAIDSQWLKDLIDLGTTLLGIVNDIINAVDELPGGIYSVLGGLGLFGTKLFSQKNALKIGGITDFIAGLFGIGDIGKEAGEKIGGDIAESIGDTISKDGSKVIKFPKSAVKNMVKDTSDEVVKQTSKSGLGKLLPGLLSNPYGLAAAGITAVVAGAAMYHKYKIDQNNKLLESGSTATKHFEEENKSFEQQVERFKQLRDEIDSGDFSDQEVLEKKKEIFGIQEQIVSMYGQQADGVNLVTGNLRRQLEVLQQIGQQQAENDLNENFDEYNAVKKLMTEDISGKLENENNRTYLGEQLRDEIVERLQEQKIPNLEMIEGPDGIGINLKASGDIYEQIEAAQQYLSLLDELEVEHRIANPFEEYDLGPYKSEASSYLKILTDLRDKYEDTYNSILTEEIQKAGGGKKLNDYADAVKNYNEALTMGNYDEVIEARKNLQKTSDDYLSWFNENASAYKLDSKPYDTLTESINRSQETLRDFGDVVNQISGINSNGDKSLSNSIKGTGKEFSNFADEVSTASEVVNKFSTKDLTNILSKSTGDSFKQLKEAYSEAQAAGITDFSQHVFGNIDLNNRGVIKWTDSTIKANYDNLKSIFTDASEADIYEMKGSSSSVLGSSSEYGGAEIAFSPMLQTDKGPVLLNQKTVDKYINGLIDAAKDANGNWTSEDVLALDATLGSWSNVDGYKITGLIADIGDTARQTGEAMHYLGDTGFIKMLMGEVGYDNLSNLTVSDIMNINALAEAFGYTGDNLDEVIAGMQKLAGDNPFLERTDEISNYLDVIKKADMSSSEIEDALEFSSPGLDTSPAINALFALADVLGIVGDDGNIASEYIDAFIQILADAGVASDGATSGINNAANSFENIVTSSQNAISSINAVNALLAQQQGGKSISYDDLNADGVKEYSSALEYNNGVLRLNAEKVKALTQEKADAEIAANELAKAEAQADYQKNVAEIERLRESLDEMSSASERAEAQMQIDNLMTKNDGIAEQCAQYDLLSQSIREATGAYQDWLNSQSAPMAGSMMKDVLTGMQQISDTYTEGSDTYGQTGKGNRKYQASLDLIIPETVDKEDDAAVQSYMNSVGDVFKKTADGWEFDEIGFLDRAVDRGLMTLDETTGEYAIAGRMTMEEFAEDAELSLGVVQAAFDHLDLYKNTFSWLDESTKSLGDLSVKAGEAADALMGAEGNEGLSIDIDVSDIDSTEQKVASLQSTIDQMQELKSHLDIEADAEQIEQANTVIEYCKAQMQELEKPVLLTADVSGLSEAQQQAVGLLNELQAAQNEKDICIELGVNTDYADQRIDAVMQKIQEFASEHPEVMMSLGIEDTSNVSSILDTLDGQTVDAIVNLTLGQDEASPVLDKMDTTEESKGVTITADDQASEAIDAVQAKTIEKKQAMVEARTEEAMSKIQAVDNKKISPKSFTVSAIDNASGTLRNIVSLVNSIPASRSSTITVTHIDRHVTQRFGAADGTAHVRGTAFVSGNAKLRGDWGMEHGERVLIGELGPEIVVDPNSGRWRTYGDNGAEFAYIPKDSIIFNHLQTESLLKQGHISSRATAMASGSAKASGTAFITGGINRNVLRPSPVASTATAVSQPASSAASVAKSSASTAKSTGKSAKNSKDFKETLDEIEILLDRVDRQIEHIDKTAQGTYRSFSERNTAFIDEINLIDEQIQNQLDGYQRYMKEANSVGLAEEWAKKVREGQIDIEKVTNEDLWNKIEDYRNWYELALDCLDAVDELYDTQADLDRQKFDNLVQQYEDIIAAIEHANNVVQSFIDITEESGHLVAAEYYAEMIKYENTTLSDLIEERDKLNEELAYAVSQARIEVGSEEFNAMQQQIDEVTESILDAEKSIVEFQNEIRQLDWDRFDMGIDWVDDLITELEFLDELLNTDNAYDKKGKVTNEGIARYGVMAMDYDTEMRKAEEYAAEIQKINGDLAKDPYNLTLIDRKRELVKAQQDSILAAKKEKEAIRDLVKEGIEKQIDSLGKLIDEYTKLLDTNQESIDYARQVAEQQKEIDKYRKQVQSWQGDDSEEGAARRQKTADELRKAEDDLAQTQEDRRISEIKSSLAELQDDFSEVLNARLDDVDALLSSVIDGVNTNAVTISEAIGTASTNVNYELSSHLDTALTTAAESLKGALATNSDTTSGAIKDLGIEFKNLVTTFENGAFKEKNATILKSIDAIYADVEAMAYDAKIAAAKRLAEEEKRKAAEAARIKAAQEAAAKKKAEEEARRKAAEEAKKNPQPAAQKKKSGGGGRSAQQKYGVAIAIINGTKGWGAGDERRRKLEQKGFNYSEIQGIVNQIWGTVASGNWEGKYYGIRYSDLDKYAYNRFAKGAKHIGKDQLAITQEKGLEYIMHNGQMLTPLTAGDSVFNRMATDNLWNMANNPSDFIKDAIMPNTMPAYKPTVVATGGNDIQMVFNLSGMKDPETFMNELQHNKKFTQLVQELTLGQANGHGKLQKNSIRF